MAPSTDSKLNGRSALSEPTTTRNGSPAARAFLAWSYLRFRKAARIGSMVSMEPKLSGTRISRSYTSIATRRPPVLNTKSG